MLYPVYTTMPLVIVDALAALTHYGARRRMPPCTIYLHATGGTDSLDWLTRTSNPPVSAHRLIAKDGTVYKIVGDEYTAWTQGNGVMGHHRGRSLLTCNTDGLSIEVENLDVEGDLYPDIQLCMVAAQVYEWHGAYGFLPILSHADVDVNKVDPAYFPWYLFYHYLKLLYQGVSLIEARKEASRWQAP